MPAVGFLFPFFPVKSAGFYKPASSKVRVIVHHGSRQCIAVGLTFEKAVHVHLANKTFALDGILAPPFFWKGVQLEKLRAL